MNFRAVGDPETHTRIEQYELAFRMQTSVPELTAITSESEADFQGCMATMQKNRVLSPTPR